MLPAATRRRPAHSAHTARCSLQAPTAIPFLSQKCPPQLLGSAEVQRVLELQRLLASGDWVGFLRAAAAAPYLQACLAHMYFARVHARALHAARASGAAPGPQDLRRPAWRTCARVHCTSWRAPAVRPQGHKTYLQACLAHMYFARVHARALHVLARASGAAPGPQDLQACLAHMYFARVHARALHVLARASGAAPGPQDLPAGLPGAHVFRARARARAARPGARQRCGPRATRPTCRPAWRTCISRACTRARCTSWRAPAVRPQGHKTYLQACLAHMYFARVHARALHVLARASGAAPGPQDLPAGLPGARVLCARACTRARCTSWRAPAVRPLGPSHRQ